MSKHQDRFFPAMRTTVNLGSAVLLLIINNLSLVSGDVVDANTRLWECQGRFPLKEREIIKRGQTHNKPLVSWRRSLCIDKTCFPADKRDRAGSRQGWRRLEIRAVYVPTPIQLRRFTSICTLPLCSGWS